MWRSYSSSIGLPTPVPLVRRSSMPLSTQAEDHSETALPIPSGPHHIPLQYPLLVISTFSSSSCNPLVFSFNPIKSCSYLPANPRQRIISTAVPSATRSVAFVAKPSSVAVSTSSVSSSLYRSHASAATATVDGSSRSSHCFPCILLYYCSFLLQQPPSPQSFTTPLSSARPTSLLDHDWI
ncbi:hypothetical protein B296_00008255 [Ensete ventricosum]|uniref:Uncharacterized protein n=1 Tax=Ensete ventricosum TaxID=4639 RepID=A0A427ANC5_ENSVE|nr:hypothetical protein B296_00008255 [Ensete ventricosum]